MPRTQHRMNQSKTTGEWICTLLAALAVGAWVWFVCGCLEPIISYLFG